MNSIKENIFRVNQQITNHEATVTVFIYGKQVNDFHIVDYDALSMLNVSATQALIKRNKNMQQKQAVAEGQLEKLEVEAEKIDELEAMILEMKVVKNNR